MLCHHIYDIYFLNIIIVDDLVTNIIIYSIKITFWRHFEWIMFRICSRFHKKLCFVINSEQLSISGITALSSFLAQLDKLDKNSHFEHKFWEFDFIFYQFRTGPNHFKNCLLKLDNWIYSGFVPNFIQFNDFFKFQTKALKKYLQTKNQLLTIFRFQFQVQISKSRIRIKNVFKK